jgi:hypothetical protein
LTVSNQSVFALRYRTDDSELVALHNLAGSTARIRSSTWKGLIDTFSNREYEQPGQTLELDGYGFRWLRPADAP